jgi:hypothetical protein
MRHADGTEPPVARNRPLIEGQSIIGRSRIEIKIGRRAGAAPLVIECR